MDGPDKTAAQLKAKRAGLRVMFYWSVSQAGLSCYAANATFAAHPDWWLKDDRGKLVQPLRIDVSVPVPVSQKLKIGQEASVEWLDIETDQPTIGKVIFISRAGEASVREVLVRIEVPNEDGLPSGMHARVAFEGE